MPSRCLLNFVSIACGDYRFACLKEALDPACKDLKMQQPGKALGKTFLETIGLIEAKLCVQNGRATILVPNCWATKFRATYWGQNLLIVKFLWPQFCEP